MFFLLHHSNESFSKGNFNADIMSQWVLVETGKQEHKMELKSQGIIQIGCVQTGKMCCCDFLLVRTLVNVAII